MENFTTTRQILSHEINDDIQTYLKKIHTLPLDPGA